jgi:hypothetical protein
MDLHPGGRVNCLSIMPYGLLATHTGNLKLAQNLLGHCKLSTTADIYKHSLPEAERKATVAVERAIFGDLFPVVPDFANRNSYGVQ